MLNQVTALPSQEFAGSIANVANSVLALGVLTALIMILIPFKPLILNVVRDLLSTFDSYKSAQLPQKRKLRKY